MSWPYVCIYFILSNAKSESADQVENANPDRVDENPEEQAYQQTLSSQQSDDIEVDEHGVALNTEDDILPPLEKESDDLWYLETLRIRQAKFVGSQRASTAGHFT